MWCGEHTQVLLLSQGSVLSLYGVWKIEVECVVFVVFVLAVVHFYSFQYFKSTLLENSKSLCWLRHALQCDCRVVNSGSLDSR